MNWRGKLVLSLFTGGLLAAVGSVGVSANTFKWANDGDANSMDPYTRNETFLLTFTQNIYDPLVRRNRKLEVEPALAARWETPNPTTWRFHLRRNVKFHGGQPFTADDVLFSYQRASGPGSQLNATFATVKSLRKIDDFTVEFETKVPDPIFLQQLTNWVIMSQAWAAANNALQPTDLTKKEENFATRNANGTGPFILRTREPDRRTTLANNPAWWDKPEHNLTNVEFNVIANAATRVAALLSGDIDMVYTVPPQDMDRIGKTAGLRIVQGHELRTIYLGFDQSRPELLKSDVKGKNPFQDRRVRLAFYMAVDETSIVSKVMRGQARASAMMIGPGVNGYNAALDKRHPYDPAKAKALLADAGYPNGFTVTMDCPNDRYVNDEQICQAVTAMLARIGVKVNLVAQTRLKYFSEINGPGYNTSFFMLGWTPPTYDAHNMFFNLTGTRDGTRGVFNNGGYANPALDKMIDAMLTETDRAKRQGLIDQASKLIHDDVTYIPLHQQVVVWAAKQKIDLQQLADNTFPLRYVRVK